MEGDQSQEKGPKKDCFAYRPSSLGSKTADCRALNELYCLKEECRFYKRKGEK